MYKMEPASTLVGGKDVIWVAVLSQDLEVQQIIQVLMTSNCYFIYKVLKSSDLRLVSAVRPLHAEELKYLFYAIRGVVYLFCVLE